MTFNMVPMDAPPTHALMVERLKCGKVRLNTGENLPTVVLSGYDIADVATDTEQVVIFCSPQHIDMFIDALTELQEAAHRGEL